MNRDKATTNSKRKQKPRRFQVDPLAALVIPEVDHAVVESSPRFEIEEDVEISPDQRIEILALSDIQPDPWNPRHILPAKIRAKLHSGKFDAESAVRSWVSAGQKDPIIAEQILGYRQMGASLLAQGQINPINVAKHFRKDGSFIWRIESGERRYWSKWLTIVDKLSDDRTIHAVIRDELDPTRQAVENLQAEALTAVGEARQVARLFLDRLDVTPDNEIAKGIPSGSDDYFRIALRPASELLQDRKRLPRGFWPALEEITGVKRQHLERKLQILSLPDKLLALADYHHLAERQLRAIIAKPQQQWEQLIQITIDHDLTGSEVASLDETKSIKGGLQMVLDRREGKPLIPEPISEIDAPASDVDGTGVPLAKRVKEKPAKEQIIQKRLVALAKLLCENMGIPEEECNLDDIVEQIIQSGEHQVVLDSYGQIEDLVERLKIRIAQLPPVD